MSASIPVRPTLFYRLMQFLTLLHIGLFIWLTVDYLFHPFETGLMGGSLPLERAIYALFIGPITLVVSVLVLRHSPKNVIGLLLMIWGIATSSGSARVDIDISLYLVLLALNPIRFVSLLLLVLLFPDGSAYPRWLHRFMLPYMLLALVMGLLTVLGSPMLQFDPMNGRAEAVNLLYVPALQAPAQLIFRASGLLVLPLFPLLFISPILRYRAADFQVRQQLKWMLFGAIIPATQLTIFLVSTLGLAPPTPDNSGVALIARYVYSYYLALFPAFAVGNAILRHRLYDIDIIINRTLVYSLLTVAIITIYALIVGSLSVLLSTQGSFEVSLVGAGVIAILFQPLRDKVQRFINRLMFGRREEPMMVIDQLGKGLEAMLSPESALYHLVQTTAGTLKLPYVAVERADSDAAVAFGRARGEPTRFSLLHHAQAIGALVVNARSPNESLNAADRLVLENVARQASSIVHAARLTADLQESRQRIVTAREEERRRLRRDLHDGLGPALATLTLQAEAARESLTTNPQKTDTLLSQIIAGTQSALADIRRVVYALRPPALDDLGLIAAINVQTAQYTSEHLSITVELPQQLPALPAAIEVALYRIVQEALANVVRHAQAKTCRVRLEVNGALQLEIHDDGQGIAETRRAGVGLNSMHERAEELGGTCVIESAPGVGTRVIVVLPLHMEG